MLKDCRYNLLVKTYYWLTDSLVDSRIMNEVQQKLNQEAREKAAEEREPKHWKELVDDIWEELLPHFRGEVYTGDGAFLFDAAEGRYLFQDEENMSEEGEDDLLRGVEDMEEEEEKEDDDEFAEVAEEGSNYCIYLSCD